MHLEGERAHMNTLQGHLQQVRETNRFQSVELQSCRQELAEQWREVEALRNRIHELTFQVDGQANRLNTAQEDLTASRVSLRSLQKEFSSLQQENAMLREAVESAGSKELSASRGLLAMQEGTIPRKSSTL